MHAQVSRFSLYWNRSRRLAMSSGFGSVRTAEDMALVFLFSGGFIQKRLSFTVSGIIYLSAQGGGEGAGERGALWANRPYN